MKKHFIDTIPISVYILVKDNEVVARVIWKYTKTRVYCSMLAWNEKIYNDLSPEQNHLDKYPDINFGTVAYADGGGYCRFSAAFENLMLMYGFNIRDVGSVGAYTVERWLEKTFIGTKAWRII